MEQVQVAICDPVRPYLNALVGFFAEKTELGFQIHGFCAERKLEKCLEEQNIDLLIVSEQSYSVEKGRKAGCVVVLSEERDATIENAYCVFRYQKPERVFKEVLMCYADSDGKVSVREKLLTGWEMIGIYSPIHRCLQSTLALTMGQLLAEKKKTVYLSFECFSGLEVLMGRRFDGNLSDLLYYYRVDREKLPLRMAGTLYSCNGLDIIPPAQQMQDLLSVGKEEWLEFISALAKSGGYEVVILDLSETTAALLPLLESCARIYTITKEDPIARAKLDSYELLLQQMDHQQILKRTKKCAFPTIHNLPESIEQYTKGQLAVLVRGLLSQNEE